MNMEKYTPRHHLLGRFEDSDREALDERLLLQTGYVDEYEAEEDRLVDEVVMGTLDEADRKDVEALCKRRPDLESRIAIGREIRRRALEKRAVVVELPASVKRRNPWGWGVAVAACAGVVILGFYLLRPALDETKSRIAKGKPANPPKETQAKGPVPLSDGTSAKAKTPEQIPKAPHEKSAPQQARPPVVLPILATITLRPLQRGSDAARSFPVPEGAGILDLRLVIGTDLSYPSYRVRVRSESATVSDVRDLRAAPAENALTVPVKVPVSDQRSKELRATLYGGSAGQEEVELEEYVFVLSTAKQP
jgi:hypothetical protein